eukprot:maker-scaffold_8-snap-gene-11.34-mRNA-1 protein AED:0.78 eAED:1.00 QI:0/0/0/1/0/0/2/0/61
MVLSRQLTMSANLGYMNLSGLAFYLSLLTLLITNPWKEELEELQMNYFYTIDLKHLWLNEI